MDSRRSIVRQAGDRYAAQRRAGFPWQRFIPELEAEYRQQYIPLNRKRLRVAHVAGILAVIGFILLDWVFGQRLQPPSAIGVLVFGTIPALLVPILATWSRDAGAVTQRYIFVCGLVMGLSLVAVVWLGRLAQTWFPYESLLLVTMYVYFVSGLLYYQAAFVGFAIWLAFFCAELAWGGAYPVLYETYYLLIANVIGLIGVYMLQYDSRLAFLLHHELRQQAQADSLTGLMNRRAFRAHLESAWLQAARERVTLGVMLIDLDGFKDINDNCGHPFGDTALQRVGHALEECARRPLDAACRYGGDEFIAIWFDVDAKWFEQLAAEFPRRLDGLQCGPPDAPRKVTVSGGAVLAWPRPGSTAQDAVRRADEKLYEMKRTCRGRIVFEPLNPEAVFSR